MFRMAIVSRKCTLTLVNFPLWCFQMGVLLLLILLLVTPESSSAQAATLQQLSLEKAKVVAYSKAFAKRFALPDPSPELELANGVQAIEFSMEMGPKTAPYHLCKLKAYLDSSLPIAYPTDGTSGSRASVELSEHFLFDSNYLDNKRWLALSVEDRLHFSRQNSFRNRAALASPDVKLPTKGYWAGIVFDAFHRNLFPGISYIKFHSECGFLADGETREIIQLWVERAGGKDYNYVVYPDPSDFLKFDLPPAFYKAAIKWAKPADEYNRAMTNAMMERNRK
jgi:hypothetical protein